MADTDHDNTVGDEIEGVLFGDGGLIPPAVKARLVLVLLCVVTVVYGVWGMPQLAGYFDTGNHRRFMGRVLGVLVFTLTQVAIGGAFLALAAGYAALGGALPPLSRAYHDGAGGEIVSSHVLAAVAFLSLQVHKAATKEGVLFREFMEALVTATLAVTQCGQWLHRLRS